MSEKKLYIAESESGSIKIGISNDPESRIQSLSTANEFGLRLDRVVDSVDDASALESALHDHLSQWRRSGEWFEESAKSVAYGFIAGYQTATMEETSPRALLESVEDVIYGIEGRKPYNYENQRREILEHIHDQVGADIGVCETCEHLAFYKITGENAGHETQCSICGAEK